MAKRGFCIFYRQKLTRIGPRVYNKKAARQGGRKVRTAQEAGGWSPITGGAFSPGKGEMLMVTYSELFQLVIMITGVATLFYHIGRHTGKRK